MIWRLIFPNCISDSWQQNHLVLLLFYIWSNYRFSQFFCFCCSVPVRYIVMISNYISDARPLLSKHLIHIPQTSSYFIIENSFFLPYYPIIKYAKYAA